MPHLKKKPAKTKWKKIGIVPPSHLWSGCKAMVKTYLSTIAPA
jgi:hypothetical protein